MAKMKAVKIAYGKLWRKKISGMKFKAGLFVF